MRIPVHSPWLPGYVDVEQTVLALLTMAGPFLDRPYIVMYTHVSYIKSLYIFYYIHIR